MSVNSELTALADAIREKSGVSGKLSIVGMTEAVSDIRIEAGDIDLEGVNVYSGVLLTGYTAVNATGAKINGTMPVMPEPTISAGTVSIPKGYNDKEFSVTVDNAQDPKQLEDANGVKTNQVAVYSGYQYTTRIITVGTLIERDTITPSTENQYIPSESYIQYGVTIEGDPNLLPENIKKGVAIFGVLGTHEGGGGTDIDFEGVTVTAETLLAGIVAIDANGQKVTGNIQTVSASSDGEYVTIPAGFHTTEQKFPVTISGDGGYDTSSVTATADTMLDGVIAIGKNGETITGNIKTVTPAVNKNVFSVEKGYVSENFTETIPESTVTETDTTATVSPGYVSSELTFNLGSGGGSSVDLSFITAEATDILSGKVGADKDGNPVTGTLVPSGGFGVFDLVKVTEFSPSTDGFTGVSQIVVSGLGGAYESANGTYNVTAETKKETGVFDRIYEHTSGDWFFWGAFTPENEEGCWYIGAAPDSGNLCYWTNEELSDGDYYFEDWDSGDAFDTVLDVTKTTYPSAPETALQLNVNLSVTVVPS